MRRYWTGWVRHCFDTNDEAMSSKLAVGPIDTRDLMSLIPRRQKLLTTGNLEIVDGLKYVIPDCKG
jgi:hypothetical protein